MLPSLAESSVFPCCNSLSADHSARRLGQFARAGYFAVKALALHPAVENALFELPAVAEFEGWDLFFGDIFIESVGRHAQILRGLPDVHHFACISHAQPPWISETTGCNPERFNAAGTARIVTASPCYGSTFLVIARSRWLLPAFLPLLSRNRRHFRWTFGVPPCSQSPTIVGRWPPLGHRFAVVLNDTCTTVARPVRGLFEVSRMLRPSRFC